MIKAGMRVRIDTDHYALKSNQLTGEVKSILLADADDTIMVTVQPDNYPHELSFYETELEELT